MRKPKIAIVHEWFDTYAGSERVVEQLLLLYPDADVFAMVDFIHPSQRGFLGGRPVTTSFIQRLPRAERHFRKYLPLMPIAVEQFDLSSYDIVISSSHAVSKGVLTGPDQLHISYVHSPIRYAWDLQHQYLRETGMTRGFKSALARLILHYVRLWDVRTSNGVDHFVANSVFIGRRIQRTYRRDAQVIYPPVDISTYAMREAKESFYLTVSRMVPYKRIPTIVEAFARMPDKKLVVIGDGSERSKAEAVAGPNVEFLGFQPTEVLRDRMQRARAFVFAAEEDFGITPVEAQACGTPVIAYGKGGALETINGLEGGGTPTGMFFYDQTPESIVEAIQRFEQEHARFTPQACRDNAQRFSPERFRQEFDELLQEKWQGMLKQNFSSLAHRRG